MPTRFICPATIRPTAEAEEKARLEKLGWDKLMDRFKDYNVTYGAASLEAVRPFTALGQPAARPVSDAGPLKLVTVALMRDGDKLAGYRALAETLSAQRVEAARRLDAAVAAELAPLKLDAARFRTRITPLPQSELARVEPKISLSTKIFSALVVTKSLPVLGSMTVWSAAVRACSFRAINFFVLGIGIARKSSAERLTAQRAGHPRD